jgi:ATP-dependent DNA helicase PIF1
MQLDDAQATEKIFGGKTVVLGGDFQQILPVVPKGGREDIVSASLFQSHLWQHVTIFCLHINMRVMAANSEDQQEFSKWVLNVGDDNLLAITEEKGVDPNWIKILSHMRLLAEDCSLRELIQTIYPDHQCHSGDAMYLMQRNILAPKNTDVDEVNNAILESLSENSHTYLSTNSLALTKKGASVAAGVSMDSLYLVEFLNTL